jgi:hypothetical protein
MVDPQTQSFGDNVVSLARVLRSPVAITNAAAAPAPEQLTLEFDKPHQLLVVVTDRMHGATFLRTLLQVKPKIIVDFRFAPHFSFTAVDGQTVKRHIEAIGAHYVQYSIPFHEFGPSLLKHDPMTIASKFSAITREKGSPQWPVMVLLKENAVASAFSPYLLGALLRDSGGKWTAEVVR